MPTTLNTFQADADAATTRIAGAVLPALFTLDRRGRPQRNPDFVESAKIVKREPKQVVLYKLNQQAVWSDGREIGAADFVSQWRALSGKNSAYWTARNAGYERIEKIERGADDLEVKITFKKPYADWKSLFTPLYPKEVTGTPASFNDGARTALKDDGRPLPAEGPRPARRARPPSYAIPRWWGSAGQAGAAGADRRAARQARRGPRRRQPRSRRDRPRHGGPHRPRGTEDKGAAGQPLSHGPGAAVTPSGALKSWALANGSDQQQAEAARGPRADRRGDQEYADRAERPARLCGPQVAGARVHPARAER